MAKGSDEMRIVILMASSKYVSEDYARRLKELAKRLMGFGIGKMELLYYIHGSRDTEAIGEISAAMNRVYFSDDIIYLTGAPLHCETLLKADRGWGQKIKAVVYVGKNIESLQNLAKTYSGGERHTFYVGDCLFLYFEKRGRDYKFMRKYYYKAEDFDLV